MSKNRRLNNLENAVGGGDRGPGDVHVIVDWLPDDEITATYFVMCEPMTEHEFRRRWPDWEPGAVTVGLNWG